MELLPEQSAVHAELEHTGEAVNDPAAAGCSHDQGAGAGGDWQAAGDCVVSNFQTGQPGVATYDAEPDHAVLVKVTEVAAQMESDIQGVAGTEFAD